MNPKSSMFIALLMASMFGAIFELGFCREFGIVTLKKLGGIRDHHRSSEIESIARFAVQEHNKNTNALLEFGRVLKAKEQVVAGKVYYLTLEAIDAGKKKVYEAKVWVKPWMNFKKLEEFKHAMDVSHVTNRDLSIVRDKLGWRKVAVHDPAVRDAANHALKIIQQMSNCMCPYQLIEILQAEAEVVEDFVKYNLLLKLREEYKDVKLKILVHKTADGKFLLNTMQHLDL